MKHLKKTFCLLAVLCLLPALLLTGCGRRTQPFQVVFGAPYINEELIAPYAEKLPQDPENPVLFSGVSFGSEDVDPATFAAGAMVMTVRLSAGEVDMMVCDLENAARYARSGVFRDLTELFTQEQLAPYSDRLLSFDQVDAEGNLTGEKTPVCGIDLTGNEELAYIMGGSPCGVFMVYGSEDPELAEALFWAIADSLD